MPTADYARRVETTLEAIEESDDVHPENKELVADFKRDLALDGKSDARIQKVTSHMKILAEHVSEPFHDMDKADVKDLIEWVHDRDVAETTKADYKKVTKQFYKWLEGDDDYPEKVDWITTTVSGESDTLPKDLLTRDDIDELKEACRNKRDRAFIAVLYETGARIGELIDLTVGDIEDHTHGRKVVIDGKTGQRRLPLVESSPALNKWLNEHPDATADSPLWCQLRDGSEELSYHYIRQKLLERPAERAGIEKPMNPHHFRHSRATELATKFKEAQLCKWFGWVQGSDVPGKYVHLSGRDIDNAYFEEQGLQPEDDEDDDDPVQACPRCEELNEKDDKFCSRCGFALSEEAKSDQAQVKADADDKKDEAESMDLLEAVDRIQRVQEENPELLEEIDL